jgi:hypothetical protein
MKRITTSPDDLKMLLNQRTTDGTYNIEEAYYHACKCRCSNIDDEIIKSNMKNGIMITLKVQ